MAQVPIIASGRKIYNWWVIWLYGVYWHCCRIVMNKHLWLKEATLTLDHLLQNWYLAPQQAVLLITLQKNIERERFSFRNIWQLGSLFLCYRTKPFEILSFYSRTVSESNNRLKCSLPGEHQIPFCSTWHHDSCAPFRLHDPKSRCVFVCV